MRSLILGATGLIGSALVAECEEHCRTHLGTWYRTPHPDHVPLDIRDEEAVADVIAELEPEAVFLAAGVCDAEYAEAQPEECHEIIVGGAANVVAAVRRLGGRLVYFSSDLVFGECRSPRREDEVPTPSKVLGRLFVEAENVVRTELPNRHVIIRTGCVYGSAEHSRHFAGRVLDQLSAGKSVSVAVDRQLQPTYARDLATATFELLNRGYEGTFHIVGPERMSEFTFAKLLAFVHHHDADLVIRIPTPELDARPQSPWLDRSKVRSILGSSVIRFPADGVRAMRDQAVVPAVRLRAA